jgi:uncharacterized protein (TIGR00375 family)
MQIYDTDLHIHSPHSIAVSQKLNLDTMNETAGKKGLNILGTGDITQPDWRKYLKEKLKFENGIYSYKDLSFIIQTELEDNDSIHHVVLLPDLTSADRLQEILSPHVKNIDGRWAGRPHVNKSPAEIVEFIEDVGGITGPAHAFTPFKSIFRQGKYSTLEEAYGTAYKKVAFLELGLSADTNLADRMESLKDITFLSNSDAHSEGVQSLGREFNRIQIEEPTFEEIRKAMFRRRDRKVVLNVGLEPLLGKYFIMFCKKCRRRVRRSIVSQKKESKNPFDLFKTNKPSFDANFNYYEFPNAKAEQDFLKLTANKENLCPACKSKINSKKSKGNHFAAKKPKKISYPKLALGVSERINSIATWDIPHHPDHRPPYLDIVPLVEIIRKLKGVKNSKAKSVQNLYNQIISENESEFNILVDLDIEKLKKFENGKLATVINAFRTRKIEYIPGGGGVFGEISIDGL